ncbi:MAG: urea carboxylase-associated family protein [Erythrobacter sp.]|nr:MAG: urea carboxylase-associated family protein [Erythrobacter sp.]
MNIIPPRSGVAFRLEQGQKLQVIDVDGCQVSDLLAFSADDVAEVVSNGRTFDYEETIRLTQGHTLWSNRSNPMLTITRDDVGCHDFLLTPCSEDTFRHFYPDKPVHRGCFGNLAEALEPFGVGRDAIPTAFNVFMNVPVNGSTGTLSVDPPPSKAGDVLELEARMDLIIGLTACSAYASNGGSFKPIGWRVN